MFTERTLHENICNQYVINLITQSVVHFRSDRPSIRPPDGITVHRGISSGIECSTDCFDAMLTWDAYVIIAISDFGLYRDAPINYVRRPVLEYPNCFVPSYIFFSTRVTLSSYESLGLLSHFEGSKLLESLEDSIPRTFPANFVRVMIGEKPVDLIWTWWRVFVRLCEGQHDYMATHRSKKLQFCLSDFLES